MIKNNIRQMTLTALLFTIGTACSLYGTEYHVSPNGLDSNQGFPSEPLLTIQAAADKAQPGDTVTVHAGIYRERVNPPRGGTSDAQRITYRAADGEDVIIKGSEVVTGWTQAGNDVWQVVLPNSFFGDFNPFGDPIQGHWFDGKGRKHHSGAVYLNGHWLAEAETKEALFKTQKSSKDRGYLFNVAWMQTVGADTQQFPATAMLEQTGVQQAPSDEGGECIGFIDEGDWASYEIDFGVSSEHMQFRVASEEKGGIIEVRLDSPDGKLLATCAVPSTRGWQKWRTVKTVIEPSSGKQKVCLVFKAKEKKNRDTPKWFARVDQSNTTIWAQFKGVDPNQELTEVNARQTVFYPEKPGLHYITLRGFTLEHAATPWSPPTTEQIGLVGTHWSKGWIIENNTIRYSVCTGVTLGKYNDPKDVSAKDTADAYNNTIEWAVKQGWTKETVGSHLVRNNHISHCEQAGIVGSLGAIFSTVTGNVIHDINQRGAFGGAEIAGVKFHAPIDSVISNNHIYRCHGTGGGIWLDWMSQGTRVSGNLLHDNSTDFFFEVNHGPLMVDNNIFLSNKPLRDWSQGTAFSHNLIAGTIVPIAQARTTPVHQPHSTQIVGLRNIDSGDNRFFNNVFLNGSDLKRYQPFSAPTAMQGNVFTRSKARLVSKADGIYLDLELGESPAGEAPLVTSELLGLAKVPNQRFEQANGAAYRLDTDYFGHQRNVENPAPGPFAAADGKEIQLKVWPKKELKEECRIRLPSGRLNILTIICDDLNDSIEGMGGHPQAKTPNIDRLMKRGVRFTNAAANVPLCGPSRASMWSGLSPLTTGYYGADQQENSWHRNPVIKQSVSLFELFVRNGYRNYATGKIYHNGHEVLSIYKNDDGFPGYGTLPNFGPIPNDGNPKHKRNGVLPPWMPEKLRKEGGWHDGFGPIQDLKQYGSQYEWTLFSSGRPWKFRNGEDRDPLPDENHAAEMVDFLGKTHDRPFIATVGFVRPHSPWYAPQKYFDLFPLEEVELTPILPFDAEDCSKILTQEHDIAEARGWDAYQKIMENGGDEQLRKWTQAYLACVAFADDQIGKVLDALDASPYADNTLVIITSDHGYHMGEKEYLFKYSPWEESARVPLVIAGPGVAENKECVVPVSLLDIYPTLVDAAGLVPLHKLDGHSLRPLLEKPGAGEWTGPLVSLTAIGSKVPVKKNTPAPAKDQHFSIRSERYRYIRCRNGEEELYDHRNDPNEWENLAKHREYVTVLETMRTRLNKALKNKEERL